MDAVKVKSRMFVIAIGIIFVLANIHNVYNLIFGNWSQGVILFKYTIQENDYTFMKRSTKRSIYIQVLLFSIDGIYTLFKDRKQELMIFATGNIYRETGTGQENDLITFLLHTRILRSKKSPSPFVSTRFILLAFNFLSTANLTNCSAPLALR